MGVGVNPIQTLDTSVPVNVMLRVAYEFSSVGMPYLHLFDVAL